MIEKRLAAVVPILVLMAACDAPERTLAPEDPSLFQGYGLKVDAATQSRTAAPGASGTLQFYVTSTVSYPQCVSATAFSTHWAVSITSDAPSSTMFNPYGSMTVNVHYSVHPNASDGTQTTIVLSAMRCGDLPSVHAHTELTVIASPPPGLWHQGSGHPNAWPGSTVSLSFKAQNYATSSRVLTLHATSTDHAVAPNPAPVHRTVQVGESVIMTIDVPVRSDARAYEIASIIARVQDNVNGQWSATASQYVRVALALRSPTVTAQWPGYGETAPNMMRDLYFSVTNRTNADRSFTFQAESSNTSAVQIQATSSSMTIPAFATRSVLVRTYAPSSATGTSQIVLRARDAAQTGSVGQATFELSVQTDGLVPY